MRRFFVFVLSTVLLVALSACSSSSHPSAESNDGSTTTSSPATDSKTTHIAPGKPFEESITLSAGEAVRFSANALGQVDLNAFLGIDDADLDAIDQVVGAGTADQLRAGSDGESLDARYRFQKASTTTLLFTTNADDWDDVLTPASAKPDDSNDLEEGAYYETRLAWVAPVAGTYWFYAVSDDAVDLQTDIETDEVAGVDATIDTVGAHLFEPSALAATFPAYRSFLSGYSGPAVSGMFG